MMKVFMALTAAVLLCHLAACEEARPDAAEERIGLRVLYVGYPGTSRESDFIAFLEKHFAKVGKGDLAKSRRIRITRTSS